MQQIFDKTEKAVCVLVSVVPKGADEGEYEASLGELARLADTAGAEVYAEMVQQKENPDPATYIGSGKLEELKTLCDGGEVNTVIFDCELSPSQIKNIEEGLRDSVSVIDRSMLILDIFALHAVSAEGKLQVELAQLKYTVPRLVGKGAEMSRLGGGIGTRGPGESQLEPDRRHVKRRMDALEAQLSELESNRENAARGARPLRDIQIRHRGLHERGQIDSSELSDGRGDTRRGQAVCDARSDDAQIRPSVGRVGASDRHGRIYQKSPAPPDQSVPLDARRSRIRGRDTRRYRRVGRRSGGAARRDERTDRRARRGVEADPLRVQQVRRGEERAARHEVGRHGVHLRENGEGVDALIGAMEKIVAARRKKYRFVFPLDKSGLISRLYTSAGTNVISLDYTESGAVAVAVCDEKTAGQLSEFIRE